VNEILKDINFVKKIYKDIINEYSIYKLDDRVFYLKHVTEVDLANVYEKYIEFFDKSKSMGVLEEKDKLNLLHEKNIWSKEKEDRRTSITNEINLNIDTKKKLIISSQQKEIDNKIKALEEELFSIEQYRVELLGMTAEEYSTRKSNEYLIYLTFCKNENLDKFFDSEDDFFNLEIEDLIKYAGLYQNFNNLFSVQNLKKTAVSSFFMNMFFLSENDPYTFFGKPLCKLTYNQINLFTLARGYKYNLERTGDMPPSFVNSLDELVQWYENRSLISKEKEKDSNKEFSGKTYIGATKQELRGMVDSKDEVVDLLKEADKKGGNLSFQEILKIHGVK
jgi:hypothetical protein